jgi:transcriptional regulator with XRE-family HTH domain
MTDPKPAPIRRRQLGIRLTELRKAAGMNQDDAVAATGLSRSTISKIENAEQTILAKNVRLMAQAYGVGAPELDMLLRMAAESKKVGVYLAHSDVAADFAKDYFELEAYASELWSYEAMNIFGLCQVPAYIRAVRLATKPTATDDELQAAVELRVARQQRLFGGNLPLLRVVLDEAALRRTVGGSAVMAEQLTHLIEVSKLSGVTLQVIPFSAGAHAAMGSAFTVLRFDETPGMDVVYLENMRSATYHEKPADLAAYVDAFEQISRAALDPDESRALLDTLRSDLWERSKGV